MVYSSESNLSLLSGGTLVSPFSSVTRMNPAAPVHLGIPPTQIQAVALQNRLRASSTSSVQSKHSATSSWPTPGYKSIQGEEIASDWQHSVPLPPLPSPGLPIETVGESSSYLSHQPSQPVDNVSRTMAFFGGGGSHVDLPKPPKPLERGSREDNQSGIMPAHMEPLSANPTGPGGFSMYTRNRQRSRESLRSTDSSGSMHQDYSKLPSEVALERAKSIQSLNRARSLNDRPPTRSNTFFSQTYAVTPPGPLVEPPGPSRNRSITDQHQPGFVSLGLGKPTARQSHLLGPTARASTMPTPTMGEMEALANAAAMPISPVQAEDTTTSSSAMLGAMMLKSPPSKLTREASNIGQSDGASFFVGQVLRDEKDAEKSDRMETGGYSLVKPLGEGAFSVVWSAEEIASGRLVAIKLMDKKLCEKNDRTRISFLREVAVLSHIKHPHIVSFIASFSTADHYCLVLDNLAGGELFDLIQRPGHRRRMGIRFVKRIFGELCRAVGWLHQAAVVHRDLKLENILFTVNPFLPEYQDANGSIDVDKLPTPLIKLSDFGLSRFIDPDHPLLRTRCGSESFAAPEIIMGQAYDGRNTDSWAVGVILFALVAGELPFDDSVWGTPAMEGESTRRKRMMRIARGHYEWPANVDASLEVREMVAKLLERDPAKRARVGDDLWDYDFLKGSGVGRPGRVPATLDVSEGMTRILDGILLHSVEDIARAEIER